MKETLVELGSWTSVTRFGEAQSADLHGLMGSRQQLGWIVTGLEES